VYLGFSNVNLGTSALTSNTSGIQNTAFGFSALKSNTTGSSNTALGHSALQGLTGGFNGNTAIGYEALSANNCNAVFNTAVGRGALRSNIGAGGNVAVGYLALTNFSLVAGAAGDNTAVGNNSQQGTSTGLSNTTVGKSSGSNISTGSQNAFFGALAGGTITTQGNNTAVGYNALKFGTLSVGAQNVTCIGYEAQPSHAAVSNEIVLGSGIETLKCRVIWIQSNSGLGGNRQNTLIGSAVGQPTNGDNTIIGYSAGTNLTAAAGNTMLGSVAGLQLTTGNFNTFIGGLAGRLQQGSTSNNTFVGYQAGSLAAITGGNNTLLGYQAGSSITTATNIMCLGYQAAPTAATASNEITLGNASIGVLRCNATTITSLSDARDKTDVAPLSSKFGLSFVEQLKPVAFKWDKREWYENGVANGTKKEDKLCVGFLAQDLKQLQEDNGCDGLNLVYESNPDKLEATYGNLLIPLIKAVQELSQQVAGLKATVDAQQTTIAHLMSCRNIE
jgi:hypothetical protein